MSEKNKVVLTADGKTYELVYNRTMQVKYQEMLDDKKHDSEYQKEVAEYTHLQNEYEDIHESFLEWKAKWKANPTDKEIKANYLELKEANKEAFDELNEYSANHKNGDGRDYSLYICGQLALLGLQTQYDLSEEKATEIWNKFVEEKGQLKSMVWLGGLAEAFFGDIEEETENPTIKRMLQKAEQTENRKAGLSKVKK